MLEQKINELRINDFNGSSGEFLILDFSEVNKPLFDKLAAPVKTNFYQLIFLSNGSMDITLDDRYLNIQAGEIFASSKNQITSLSKCNECRGYLFLFTEEFICRSGEDYGRFSNYFLFKNSFSSLNPETKQFSDLLVLVRNMEMEVHNKNPFVKIEIIHHLLKTILLVLERMKRECGTEIATDSRDISLVKAFKDNLESGFQKNHSVNYYSGLLNVTPKKLNRVSLDHYGKPVKKIIEERVFLETKRLLKYSALTVKEISNNVGFSDPAYFNRFFKKFASVTPVEFRASSRSSF